jgi:hypothetical protein
MAGKLVLKAQTAHREKNSGSDQSKNGDQNRFSARAKPGPGPTVLCDHSNQAFVVDGTTGHAYFLLLPPTSTPLTYSSLPGDAQLVVGRCQRLSSILFRGVFNLRSWS